MDARAAHTGKGLTKPSLPTLADAGDLSAWSVDFVLPWFGDHGYRMKTAIALDEHGDGVVGTPEGLPPSRPASSEFADYHVLHARGSGIEGKWPASVGSAAGEAVQITYDISLDLSAVPTSGAGVSYGHTFALHSNPNSTYKIFLDLDGFTTTGTLWNANWGQSTFYSPAFMLGADGNESFSADELRAIQQMWQRVAEYFAPFNVDVTTEDPGVEGLIRTDATDQSFGIRVVITDEGGKSMGGIAYVGSFDWDSDTPVYVYADRLADNARYIGNAIAHEVGHSLGLGHDGQTVGGTTSSYYYGHGSGVTDWAPIMGVGYNGNIVQWSRGEYYGANQLQDDLAIILSQNSGVAYRSDDFGDDLLSASPLSGAVDGNIATVLTYGIISGSGIQNDVDMFRIDVAASGSIDLAIMSWTRAYVSGLSEPIYALSPATMLDLLATVYDAAGNAIFTSNDPGRLDVEIHLGNLAGGTYYIGVDGVGFGNPLVPDPIGYTEYGSLGQYRISGTYSYAGAGLPDPPGDSVAPSLASLSPLDNATNVATGANLILTFSEAVKAGTGNIVVHNADGSVWQTIGVGDGSQVSFAGSSVTLNPSTDLAAGSGYYVNLSAGAVTDLAGNPFTGIAGVSAFNFQTAPPADTSAPTLSILSPVDNATNVATGANLVLGFSEAVKAGSGNIVICNADGSVWRTINVGDSSQVSFAGSNLTINPGTDLTAGSGYYVNVSAGAVTDLAGNAFAGIAGANTYNFQTAPPADTSVPSLSSLSPADNATNVATGANLVLTFSEAVKAGSGNIIVYNADGSVWRTFGVGDSSQVSFAGSSLTINPGTNLAAGSGYYVNLAAGAVTDLAGNAFAGIAGVNAFNFQTALPADTIAPSLSSLSPADNATNIATGANLVLTFSEAVKAGSGNIVVYNADGSVWRTIGIGDSSQVSFAGSSLTINPTGDLAAGSGYYVNLSAGAVTDLAGNPFAGIAGTTSFDFVTAASGWTVFGTPGPDQLTGSSGADRFFGEGGNDTLTAGVGDDILDGGAGSDLMIGGPGDDTYAVDSGTDTVSESAYAGMDIVQTSLASYSLGPNVETLTYTGTASFSAYGNSADNRISGGGQGDTLRGASGNDSLFGGGGADLLQPGTGLDILAGGEGADRFLFNSASEAGSGLTRDLILDFEPGDIIDLSALDAVTGRPGNQAFSFIGTQGFSGSRGELHIIGDILSGDVNGDAQADFEIRILNFTSLTSTSFIL